MLHIQAEQVLSGVAPLPMLYVGPASFLLLLSGLIGICICDSAFDGSALSLVFDPSSIYVLQAFVLILPGTLFAYVFKKNKILEQQN